MPEIQLRPARPEDGGRLQTIRRLAFAPVFASFRSMLGDDIYDLAQRRSDEAQEGLLTSLMAGHAPARRAYRKVGFDVEIPSVWMFRKL